MSASADGSVLTHVGAVPVEQQLSWFDRTGKQLEPVGEPQVFREGVRLSPDGKRIAVVIPDADSGNRDIWLMDAAGGTRTRLTTHPANDWFPEWSPDGSQIIFATDRDGASSLYRKATDSSGSDELVLKSGTPDGPIPDNWSADGRFVVLQANAPKANLDIWVLPMFGDRKPYPLVQTPFNEEAAVFSPDGKWVAYMSNESGANEIYVRPFDKPGKQRISKAGGMLPRWSRDGHELFYMEGVKMMSAAVTPGDALAVRAPSQLFDACAPPATVYDYHYDVSNDGKRFLIRCPLQRTSPLQVNVWVNWLEELKRHVLTGTK